MKDPISTAPDQIRRAAAHQIRLRERRSEAVKRRVGEAWTEVARLTRIFLGIDPDIEKLVLFGSLARGDTKSPGFDIDLAVVCSRDRYLRLVAEALNSPFGVDVVELNAADERIRGSIWREGIVLYEK